MKLDIEYLLKNLTLEEKAGLCSGADNWFTKAVERLGLPSIMMTDGPHGLRKQAGSGDNLGLEESVKAVCFPAGCALASSFDRGLMQEVGDHLGEEARSENVHTLLGPAINMKRSPLCGRNFEYLSEDPYQAGEMASGYVKGVQGRHVGVCVKHFAANSQESRRMSISARVDERTLREIYLTAFEKVVRQASPWSLMCSYNRINGVYSCENDWLLNHMLRDEWGFDGIVMSDWGAVNDRCRSLKAGLNLEMPYSRGVNDAKIVAAVKNGELDEEILNKSVRELLEWIGKGLDDVPAAPYDKEAHHAFARRAAGESAVLLKNDGLLPLKKGCKVAFIGGFAKAPRYQGGGSSHINSFRVSDALEAAKGIPNITYSQGVKDDGITADAGLFAEAVRNAKEAEAAVIFAGLPDSFESEGYDRTHMDLPECQNELIKAVAKVQPNTVVVLHNGSPVTMPWAEDVASILEMYLGGQAVGGAEVDLLYGDVNPSGKLAETFPLRLEDTPSYLNFPGERREVSYGEGIFIGYRWYDARKMQVLFPFGYGLSYTSFEVSGLTLSRSEMKDTDTLLVRVSVKNTGKVSGKEVVQIYVGAAEDSDAVRPIRELKGFVKVVLEPGEEKTVEFTLDKRSFAVFDSEEGEWVIPDGNYRIYVGNSSRNLPLSTDVKITGTQKAALVLQEFTTIGDVLRCPGGQEAMEPIIAKVAKAFGVHDDALGDGFGKMVDRMMQEMPLHSICSFAPVAMDEIKRALGGILRE